MSDGKLSLSATLAEAKNTYGMKWLVVTDHWTSGSGMGGVIKYPSTNNAPAGFPSYFDTVLRYGFQLELPVGPACEWSTVKLPLIPFTGAHVLGFGLSRTGNTSFPAMFAEKGQELVDKLNAHNADAFTVAAHPVGTQSNGYYPWDWKVARNDSIELMTDMATFEDEMRSRWFARLQSEVNAVMASGPSGNFTVGIATSDGHANGLTKVAGGASMTWLALPAAERNLPSPKNVGAMWKRLRRGTCVASGEGDFASAAITATAAGVSATAGPGELVRCAKSTAPKLAVTYAARTGHRLKSIDVWHGDADGVVKAASYAVDQVSGTKSATLTCSRQERLLRRGGALL